MVGEDRSYACLNCPLQMKIETANKEPYTGSHSVSPEEQQPLAPKADAGEKKLYRVQGSQHVPSNQPGKLCLRLSLLRAYYKTRANAADSKTRCLNMNANGRAHLLRGTVERPV